MTLTFEDALIWGVTIAALALALTCIAAWATHVIACLQSGEWSFLIAGAFFAPIGVVHGVGIWLGAF